MRFLQLILSVVWALPWTLLGGLFGLIALARGGRMQRTGRVLEFSGGVLPGLLRRAPVMGGAAAITFGHVVLARSQADLNATRSHELVHVRQYERWGILFVPLYLLASLILWLRGKNAYFDNPFEREAYEKAR